MGYLLIKKEKNYPKDIRIEYGSSFDVFKKMGQKVSKVFDNINYYLEVFNGLNSNSYYKEFENGDFIVTMGTLFYNDKFGNNCLVPLFEDFKKGKRDLYNDLMGSYSIIIFIKNKLYTFNDFLGLMRVYSSADNKVFSTSFLAVAISLKTKTPSTQEIYEYIIRGGMYGDKTILKEVNLIPRAKAVCVIGDCTDENIEYKYKRLPFYNNFGMMVDYVSDKYIETFGVIKNTFDMNITTALSGGYDTRLMLALFKKNNNIPHLYVYGDNNSLDVKVAKDIAKGEGIDLEHINKISLNLVNKNNYNEVVRDNFYFFDGFNVNGIFDDGMDVYTRKQRASEGILQINGAGGEVWRNFWQLNSFKKKTIDFARHKWDIYNYKAFSPKFNKKVFFENFSKKINHSIEKSIDNTKLNRKEIEMIYPLYRYRYWQSIGNSINLGFQHTIMPLMETKFLYPSFDLPIQFKFNGKFEAALINKIDWKVASYKSDRGFSFSKEAPIKYRFKSMLMRNIPLNIKPYLRYNFSIKSNEHIPYFLKDDYLSGIIDFNDFFVSKYIDIQRIKDHKTFSRILTIEYLLKNI